MWFFLEMTSLLPNSQQCLSDSGYTSCSAQCLVPQWIHIFVSLRRAIWTKFPMFYVPVDPGPRGLALLRAKCLARRWIHVQRQFPGIFERFFPNFPREGIDSDPVVAAVLLHATDEPLVSGSRLVGLRD